MELSLIQKITIWILPILFAITLHEAAHGWVASKLGDKSAYILGRVSLNPLHHIDWLGTVFFPIVLLISTGFVFGWARPVPINSRYFSNPKRDIALTAAAGPLSNFLMALFWAGVGKIALLSMGHDAAYLMPVYLMGIAGLTINLSLFWLNLLPIPPLDGSRILSCFLPPRAAHRYNQFQSYGFMILILLMISGLLNVLFLPVQWMQQAFMILFGLSF